MPALLLHEHGRVLQGYLRKFLADRDAAEDVLQTVLLEAWLRRDSFDPERGSVLSWVMTIARTRAIDSLRRRTAPPLDPTTAEKLTDRASSVEDHAEHVASRWQLNHLLSLLPGDLAELLRLRFQLEMTQQEIAVQTGLPLGTVKTRMGRALRTLRDLLDDGDGAATRPTGLRDGPRADGLPAG